MFRRKSRASESKESMRIRVIEDDPDVTSLARQVLESYEPVEFRVEFVTTSRQLRDQLGRSAFRDESTGAHSAPFFLESLNYEGLRARRFGRDLSCLALSLDDFSLDMDPGDHLTGEAARRKVAGLLQELVRTGDLVALYREDEFCILLIETSLDEATSIAERIRFQIASQAASIDGESLSMTASIGVSSFARTLDESPEAVLDRAAAALKDAKSAGKNRVCVNSPEAQATGDESDSGQVDLGQQKDTDVA